MDPCQWAYTSALVGPVLALLYAVLVLIFRASWHDCSWGAMTKPIGLRVAHVTAGLATAIGLCKENAPLREAIAPVGAFLTLVSLYFIYQTRRHDVEGGPAPDVHQDCMEGKVVFVTGANSGIGKETVRQLYSFGATVIVGCRSESRAREAMDNIIKTSKHKDRFRVIEPKLHFVPLDLSDLGSVRRAAQAFLDLNLPLHVLINNAGVMMKDKEVTKDGYEVTMQANHLGHFLLTLLLIPKLQESEDARVLNVTSSTYTLAKNGLDFDDLFCESKRPYTLFGQYAQSKLANILFTKELAKRYKNPQAYAIHPGLVRTDVVRNMPWYLRYPNMIFAFAIAPLQKTAYQGAYTSVLSAAIKPPRNGAYLANCRMQQTTEAANNAENEKKLWELSERLVGLKNKSS